MQLRHLRYFIAVAEELHFARAAERLHIEQSPLSRAIKELEDNLNVQLFERTTRSTRLTWTGQVFLDEARRVLAASAQARATVISTASGFGAICVSPYPMALPRRAWRPCWPKAAKKNPKSRYACLKRHWRNRSRACITICTIWVLPNPPNRAMAFWFSRCGAIP